MIETILFVAFCGFSWALISGIEYLINKAKKYVGNNE